MLMGILSSKNKNCPTCFPNVNNIYYFFFYLYRWIIQSESKVFAEKRSAKRVRKLCCLERHPIHMRILKETQREEEEWYHF